MIPIRMAAKAWQEGFQRLVDAAETALHDMPQAHYKHWDSKGQAGVACPACNDQSAARVALDVAVEEAKKVLAMSQQLMVQWE